jgi:hypothetical protein
MSIPLPRRFTGAGRILLTLWVGGLWTVGYLVVPVLFHELPDRRLAGDLAGHLFSALAWVGLACGGILLATALVEHGRAAGRVWQVWVLVTMLTLVAVIQFGLTPPIEALKAAAPGGFTAGSELAARFGLFHEIASSLYLALSLLGFLLVAYGMGDPESWGTPSKSMF